ncbi:DMT family transporter [Desulfofalx alkaliphila]|uniref:DMT family transporter n=1 Tax=Desulfofalx alkaliphila TaxID=105483 RepID=UPI0004E2145E|nr:EamA family transporter [Desulfofalx alkaliphila]
MKKGYILVAMGAACWGSVGALSNFLFEQGLSSFTVANYRVLLSMIIIGLYLLIFKRTAFTVHKKDLPLFALMGLISVCLFNMAYIGAIRLTTIVTAVILLYTAPVFVTIISRFTFKEPITLQKAVALVLTLAGCALVVEAYNPANLKLNFVGILVGLCAGLTYGLYSIFGKKALRAYSSWTTVFYSFLFGTFFISIVGRPWETVSMLLDSTTLTFLLLIALIPTVLAYALYTAGLKYVETSKASIVATVEPVVAVLLAALLFQEYLTWPQFVGVLMVLASVVLIQLPAVNKKAA